MEATFCSFCVRAQYDHCNFDFSIVTATVCSSVYYLIRLRSTANYIKLPVIAPAAAVCTAHEARLPLSLTAYHYTLMHVLATRLNQPSSRVWTWRGGAMHCLAPIDTLAHRMHTAWLKVRLRNRFLEAFPCLHRTHTLREHSFIASSFLLTILIC